MYFQWFINHFIKYFLINSCLVEKSICYEFEIEIRNVTKEQLFEFVDEACFINYSANEGNAK